MMKICNYILEDKAIMSVYTYIQAKSLSPADTICTYHTGDFSRSKQLHEPRDNTTVDDSLYSLHVAIGEVGEGPAGITHDFFVLVIH